MKRKLIDLKDSTFDALSSDAALSGTNLKKYIEDILDEKAGLLEDKAVCEYRFTSSQEPSDKDLSMIMACAADAAAKKNQLSMSAFYSNIRRAVFESR